MSDYEITYLLKSEDEGQTFNKWPLHVTLLPWFSVPNQEKAKSVLAEIATKHPPIKLSADGSAQFGHHRVVRLIVSTPILSALYDELTFNLKDIGGEFTVKLYEAYQPHVTNQGDEELEQGAQLVMDSLYLIEAPRLDGGGHGTKKIVGKFALSGK